MRLNIKLPQGWAIFDNPDGPPTYCRELSETPGPLQISWAEYAGGELPNPSADDLKRMTKEFGESHGFGELVESTSGPCEFGTMGSAVFCSTDHPRIQLWHLSNGRDFVMVTHFCPTAPDPVEVRERKRSFAQLPLARSRSERSGETAAKCWNCKYRSRWRWNPPLPFVEPKR